jgi:glutathione synthase/RimK-type ligase-like ATP-grasp enzyme
MEGMTVVGVYREEIFSPGKVLEDADILDHVLFEMSSRGYQTLTVKAEALDTLSMPPVCALVMAQSDRALHILEGWHKSGSRIINSVPSIRNCYRKYQAPLLARAQIPFPLSRILPLEKVEGNISFGSSKSYWLKRGDVHAMKPADVAKVASAEELVHAIDHFRQQAVEEILIQENVAGEVIKFYGVGIDQYFSASLAHSGDEVASRMKQLQSIAQRAAEAVELEIYGGDAIINQKGEVVLIDLNDWPSFSRCCEPAAKGIAQYITHVLEGDFDEVSTHC